MNKIDDSLLEVWEMKEAVYNDFKNSKFDNIIDYIESEIVEVQKKFKLKYHFGGKDKDKQLKTA